MSIVNRATRSLTRRFHRSRSLAAIVISDASGRMYRFRARAQNQPAAVYPLYFACAADVSYLQLSIRSLAAHAGGHVGRIYIYQDRQQPFTAAQKLTLAEDIPVPVVYRTTPAPMSWGGVTLLHNELRAFMDLSRELGADDFIMKVDSDVLFTASWLFPTVLGAGADLVGQPVASFATHTRRAVPDIQGGCYFLRAGALPQLRSVSLLAAAREVARTPKYHLWTIPEDRTISQWAHDARVNILVTDFYLLDLAGLRSSSFATDAAVATCLRQAGAFAVIHFERCKDKMAPCYAWLFEGERDAMSPDLRQDDLCNT